MSDYCTAASAHSILQDHHDNEHGFPVRDDDRLFEYLLLEINQAGLSWLTIMKKRESLRAAYADFSSARVALFSSDDKARLLADKMIIRNRLKIEAAIFNAQRFCEIKDEYGSFAEWLDERHPMAREDWVRLFRKNFRFVGYEIVGEFLMGIGYLQGAHVPSCRIFNRVLAQNPPWANSRV